MEDKLIKLINDVVFIFNHLDLFKKLGDIIDKNQSLKTMDQTLLTWMRNAFIVDLVISIGRICDDDARTSSLVQFLKELKQKEEYLTRKRHVELYNTSDSSVLDIPNRTFDNLAGKKEQIYPPAKIEADISRITRDNPCYKILYFRHQYIAHSDSVKTVDPPTLGELFEAFEIIKEIVLSYNVLIWATAMMDLTPSMQGDWAKVLTIPWVGNRKEIELIH